MYRLIRRNSLSGPQQLLSEDGGVAVEGRRVSVQDGGQAPCLCHRCRHWVGLSRILKKTGTAGLIQEKWEEGNGIRLKDFY